MKLPKVTIKDILSWSPCDGYNTEADLKKLAGRRKSFDALFILDLKIPLQDHLWCVLREEMIPAPILHEFACCCAERALQRERKAGREPDPKSWAAIEAKRKWLRGEISDEGLHVAQKAAWYVASCVKCVASSYAAYAAWNAARNAENTTARDVAWGVDSYAEYATRNMALSSYLKERQWQIKKLKKMLGK